MWCGGSTKRHKTIYADVTATRQGDGSTNGLVEEEVAK